MEFLSHLSQADTVTDQSPVESREKMRDSEPHPAGEHWAGRGPGLYKTFFCLRPEQFPRWRLTLEDDKGFVLCTSYRPTPRCRPWPRLCMGSLRDGHLLTSTPTLPLGSFIWHCECAHTRLTIGWLHILIIGLPQPPLQPSSGARSILRSQRS